MSDRKSTPPESRHITTPDPWIAIRSREQEIFSLSSEDLINYRLDDPVVFAAVKNELKNRAKNNKKTRDLIANTLFTKLGADAAKYKKNNPEKFKKEGKSGEARKTNWSVIKDGHFQTKLNLWRELSNLNQFVEDEASVPSIAIQRTGRFIAPPEATEERGAVTEEITTMPLPESRKIMQELEARHPTPLPETPSPLEESQRKLKDEWIDLVIMRDALEGQEIGGLKVFGKKLFGKKVTFVGDRPAQFDPINPLAGLELPISLSNDIDAKKYEDTEIGKKLAQYAVKVGTFGMSMLNLKQKTLEADIIKPKEDKKEKDSFDEQEQAFFVEGDRLAKTVEREQLLLDVDIIEEDIAELKTKGKNTGKLEMKRAEILNELGGQAKAKGPGLLALIRQKKGEMAEAWEKTTKEISRENINKEWIKAQAELKQPIKKAAAIGAAAAVAGAVGVATYKITDTAEENERAGITEAGTSEVAPSKSIMESRPPATASQYAKAIEDKLVKTKQRVAEPPTTAPKNEITAPTVENKSATYRHTVDPKTELGTGLFFAIDKIIAENNLKGPLMERLKTVYAKKFNDFKGWTKDEISNTLINAFREDALSKWEKENKKQFFPGAVVEISIPADKTAPPAVTVVDVGKRLGPSTLGWAKTMAGKSKIRTK